MLYIFITALTNSFQNPLFFLLLLSGFMQSKQKIYILFIAVCPFKLLVSGSTITFHVQQLLVSIYCILKKRNMLPRASLRAPHLVQLSFYVLNIYLFIYSSVITRVFNNKVFMISYSTEARVACF